VSAKDSKRLGGDLFCQRGGRLLVFPTEYETCGATQNLTSLRQSRSSENLHLASAVLHALSYFNPSNALPWARTRLSDENFAGRALIAALFGFAAMYVALALTPSHYAIGLQALGISAHPLLGTAKSIRSDEYVAMTPLFQIAVLGHFSATDVISPYHESLKGFWALPILDWSLIFKPQLWAFWLVPPAYAYSFYFATLWLGFLIGYGVFLRQLGASLWLAAFGSLALYMSHFVQVWWTSNAPTFAFAPWPFIVFLLPIRPILKIPFLFWVISFWIFSYVYPAFIISAGFALTTLLLAFRRDAITIGNVLAGFIASCAVMAVFFLYFGDLIALMQHTQYPGNRFAAGGGVEISKIVAHLLPFFTSSRFDPLLSNSNECEVAVVSTLLPLTVIVFANYRSAATYVRENKLACFIFCVGLTMMLAWMILPVPADWGMFLLWHEVPGNRMIWGFGLLLILGLTVIASKIEFNVSHRRLILFFLSIVAAGLSSKLLFTLVWPAPKIDLWAAVVRSWFDWVPIFVFSVPAVLAVRTSWMQRAPAPALFSAAALSGCLTFGTFNPVQSAHPIFAKHDSLLLERAREQAKANPNGWAVMPGGFGALLNGAGISAIDHTLTAPQLAFFRKIFPDLAAEQFNQAFNRYAHIVVERGAQVHVNGFDQIIVPQEAFLRRIE
jgi:hypothetical protein